MTASAPRTDIDREDPRRDADDGEAAVGCDLIEMRTVRLPDRLAADQAPQQGDGRIGEIVERHHDCRGEMAARRYQEQEPSEQEPDRQTADVAEKELARPGG